MLRSRNTPLQGLFRTVDAEAMSPRPDPDPFPRGPDPRSRRTQAEVRPAPADAGLAADRATDRLGVLTHELSNLIDSTMRYVSLARAEIACQSADALQTGAGRQLDAACAGLQRMGELVHAAMQPCAGWLAQASARGLSLHDAINHALDVLRPFAAERLVRLEQQCSDRIADVPAGPLYTVVSNGLRNAIEACERTGRVRIEADLLPTSNGLGELRIDIIDDGEGLSDEATTRAFDAGFSTKPGNAGLGLALSEEIIRQLGGVVALEARAGDDGSRGARLIIRCPPPARAP